MTRALLALLALGALALLEGCPTPVCSTLATRCDGSRAEVCASDGQWQTVTDCDELEEASGGAWECAPLEERGVALHACVPTRSR